MNVASGHIAKATVADTRTEKDLHAHVSSLMEENKGAKKYHWVMDCLNTHPSEVMVRLAAALEDEPIELGVKGKRGLLKSMLTRAEFLTNSSHRLVVYFTPKHCSWLNPGELWFSMLLRKLLRRASFTSPAQLKRRILGFVDYFNRTMAKPFKWTYKGKPLVA